MSLRTASNPWMALGTPPKLAASGRVGLVQGGSLSQAWVEAGSPRRTAPQSKTVCRHLRRSWPGWPVRGTSSQWHFVVTSTQLCVFPNHDIVKSMWQAEWLSELPGLLLRACQTVTLLIGICRAILSLWYKAWHGVMLQLTQGARVIGLSNKCGHHSMLVVPAGNLQISLFKNGRPASDF